MQPETCVKEALVVEQARSQGLREDLSIGVARYTQWSAHNQFLMSFLATVASSVIVVIVVFVHGVVAGTRQRSV